MLFPSEFCKIQKAENCGFLVYYQRVHRWTWYSNAWGVAKEIDHILVSTRWRILQNCRVFRSAKFFAITGLLLLHSSFISSPESLKDATTLCFSSICNISAELLKAGGEAMIRGLHAVLTAVWHSGNTIPPDWKKGLVVPIWKGKGDRQDCSNYHSGITLLSVPGKVLLAHLLLTWLCTHLLKHQRPE